MKCQSLFSGKNNKVVMQHKSSLGALNTAVKCCNIFSSQFVPVYVGSINVMETCDPEVKNSLC